MHSLNTGFPAELKVATKIPLFGKPWVHICKFKTSRVNVWFVISDHLCYHSLQYGKEWNNRCHYGITNILLAVIEYDYCNLFVRLSFLCINFPLHNFQEFTPGTGVLELTMIPYAEDVTLRFKPIGSSTGPINIIDITVVCCTEG